MTPTQADAGPGAGLPGISRAVQANQHVPDGNHRVCIQSSFEETPTSRGARVMAWKTKLIAGVAVAAFAWPAMAAADEATEARIKALEEQLALLQGQIADLKQSTAKSAAAARGDAPMTTVSLANGRPTLATADGRFTASFRGVFQLDSAHYDQGSPGPLGSDFRRGSFGSAAENDHARDLNDGANFRRARIGIEGKA